LRKQEWRKQSKENKQNLTFKAVCDKEFQLTLAFKKKVETANQQFYSPYNYD
jgi:hypothetical protein